MASKRRPAREVAQDRGGGEYWIDHAAIEAHDADWLGTARWLTLWNVTVPDGFLATLPELWGLDLRGGSATDVRVLDGCERLRCLVINQVRGLRDLSAVTSLGSLELLSLYGLRQVSTAPSLGPLRSLRRLEVGQMRGIQSLGGLLDAPHLEELFLVRAVNISAEDVERIRTHPTIASFDWFGEDVPVSRWQPVVDTIALPKPTMGFPKEWFKDRG